MSKLRLWAIHQHYFSVQSSIISINMTETLVFGNASVCRMLRLENNGSRFYGAHNPIIYKYWTPWIYGNNDIWCPGEESNSFSPGYEEILLGLLIAGIFITFGVLGIRSCIKLNTPPTSALTEVSTEVEGIWYMVQQSHHLTNTNHHYHTEELPLPRYEEAVNMPTAEVIEDTEFGGLKTEKGLDKVKSGEEPPPDYEVARQGFD